MSISVVSQFKVCQSNIQGVGLFADLDFNSGERLFPLFWLKKGEHFTRRRLLDLPIEWPYDIMLHDFACVINHQKKYNCLTERENDTWYCKTVQKISKGTEITLDYEALPPNLGLKHDIVNYNEID